jgi:predicted DNA-binding WGR domain protein
LFLVEQKSAVHTGGTKFYQTIVIAGGGRSACVNHWGKYPGRVPRPNEQGESQLETYPGESQAHTASRAKQGAKEKRGYSKWRSTSETVRNVKTLFEFINRDFPGRIASELLTHFGGTTTAATPVEEPKKKQPIPPAPSAPKPTEWGSW